LSTQLAFLGAATTNEIALARSRGDDAAAARAATVAATLAAVLGLVIGLWTALSARRLLENMCGAGSPHVALGLSYVRIRALVLPFTLLRVVNAAALMGARDSLTPMLSLFTGCFVNAVGNRLLIPTYGMTGAAVSTAASELVSSFILITVLQRLGQLGPLSSLPQTTAAWREALVPFLRYGPMIFTTSMKELLNNSAAATAARLGGTRAAAHTVVASVQRFGIAMGNAGNTLARAYLPQYVEVPLKPQPGTVAPPRPGPLARLFAGPPLGFDHATARPTVGVVLKVCLGLSLMSVAFSSIVLKYGVSLFTADPAVAGAVARVLPATASMLAAHATSVMLEGILLSRRDLGFIALTYAGFAVFSQLSFAALLRRERDVSTPPVTLAAVWAIFATFQILRCGIFAVRAGVLELPKRKAPKRAASIDTPKSLAATKAE